jgi:hypothetical protein
MPKSKRYTLKIRWKHNLRIAYDFAALVAELVAGLANSIAVQWSAGRYAASHHRLRQ